MFLSLNYGGVLYAGYSAEDLIASGVPESVVSEALASHASAEIASNRQSAYQLESDPLFLEALRKDAAGDSEGAEEARAAALVAIEAIKARYPL